VRIFVQIEFGSDLDAAVTFLEDNNLDGRVLFDTTVREARAELDEVRAEDAAEEAADVPPGELH
jgi:hypothetical protein